MLRLFRHRRFWAFSAVLLLLAGGAAGAHLLMSGDEASAALNLGFEQVVDSTGTPRYWRTTQRSYDVTTDASVARSGERSLRIRSTGHSTAGRPGVAVWVIPGQAAIGKTVRLTGWIRTSEAARGQARLGLRINGPASDVLVADTAKYAEGSAKKSSAKQELSSESWRRYVAEVDVPQDAEQVVFWTGLKGWGSAWFDDLRLSIDGTPYEPSPAFRASEKQVAWVRSEAIPFETTDPKHSLRDLRPITEIVSNARIVGLGEGTHGTREFFQMKHRLTELLAKESGFTVFAIEANMPEARRVNRYIQTGRGDPREAIDGLYFWTWDTEEVLAMVEWMRRYNASGKRRIAFWGFDMQEPTVAMDSVQHFVERYGTSAYADSLAATYAEIERAHETRGRGAGRSSRAAFVAWHREARCVVSHLKQRRTAYRQAGADSAAVAWAVQNARVVRQVAATYLPDEPSRDESMARNVEWIMSHTPPGAKAVLWAHNGHVNEAKKEGSMGYHLSKSYGEDYLAFGFAFHEGRYTAIGDEGLGPYRATPSEPGSVEHVFYRTGLERFVLDLRESECGSAVSGWLREKILHRRVGAVSQPWAFLPAIPADAYDAMVYVEKSTPSRGL